MSGFYVGSTIMNQIVLKINLLGSNNLAHDPLLRNLFFSLQEDVMPYFHHFLADTNLSDRNLSGSKMGKMR